MKDEMREEHDSGLGIFDVRSTKERRTVPLSVGGPRLRARRRVD